MAHFCKVDNGTVTDLIVINNDDCGGGDYPDSEPIGQAFIAGLAAGDPRLEGTWLQTSYNDNFRGRLGQIGYTYDPSLDVFIAPRPYASWTVDETGEWQPPVPHPGGSHVWDEDEGSWIPWEPEGAA
jgi:hypothetical protein